MKTTPAWRPAPDAALLIGSLLATAGYLLPWFKQSRSYGWSYSGWAYASLSSGGGWTLWTFVFLAVALVAGVWAHHSVAAAMWGVVGTVGAGLFSAAVVAASFSHVEERGSLNYLAEVPFHIGLPVLAAGLGLALAGGIRAVVHTTLRET